MPSDASQDPRPMPMPNPYYYVMGKYVWRVTAVHDLSDEQGGWLWQAFTGSAQSMGLSTRRPIRGVGVHSMGLSSSNRGRDGDERWDTWEQALQAGAEYVVEWEQRPGR